jgi:hypothetical protein
MTSVHKPDNESRRGRFATLVIWLLWAWLIMTLSHELGHVLAGWIGGAQLIRLELRPWHLPDSIFAADRHRLVTLWAGPVLGSAVPLMAAVTIGRPMAWFTAWFCLLANASYLLLGYVSGDVELDSAKLIRAGAQPWHLIAAVALALPLGYYKFRQACADLLSGASPAMTAGQMRASIIALAITWIVQAAIATLIHAQLAAG